jgi:pimeloyl-ACP methyl ester carboxylesterase
MLLPHQGILVPAQERKFDETIILIHHFGGNRASMKRYQDYLQELGFDSVAFTLGMPYRPDFIKGTLAEEIRPRLRSRWQKEITEILDAVPGPKIVYSFSFPSAAAAVSMAGRTLNEIRAWVCDGGPFLMPLTCFWNYFTHYDATPRLWRRAARVAMGIASLEFWSLAADLRHSLNRFRPEFPILSIRSWQDPLVPIAAIDVVFKSHKQLHLETLTLPEAGHIDGFLRFPSDYKPRLAQFLSQHARTHGHSTDSL